MHSVYAGHLRRLHLSLLWLLEVVAVEAILTEIMAPEQVAREAMVMEVTVEEVMLVLRVSMEAEVIEGLRIVMLVIANQIITKVVDVAL